MTSSRVIFVSAVSAEFHSRTPGEWHRFHSYRDVLDQAFRRIAPEYEVVLQENLPVGLGDLLETIDQEVSRSLLVVHLSGEMAGAAPAADSVVRLHARHPDLLAVVPSLRSSLVEESTISYTQWELYLGIHHRKPHLVFVAHPEAPRSPQFARFPRTSLHSVCICSASNRRAPISARFWTKVILRVRRFGRFSISELIPLLTLTSLRRKQSRERGRTGVTLLSN